MNNNPLLILHFSFMANAAVYSIGFSTARKDSLYLNGPDPFPVNYIDSDSRYCKLSSVILLLFLVRSIVLRVVVLFYFIVLSARFKLYAPPICTFILCFRETDILFGNRCYSYLWVLFSWVVAVIGLGILYNCAIICLIFRKYRYRRPKRRPSNKWNAFSIYVNISIYLYIHIYIYRGCLDIFQSNTAASHYSAPAKLRVYSSESWHGNQTSLVY